MDIRKGEALKEGDKVYGNKVRIKVVKNKVAPPFRVCKFDMIFGEGISRVGEIIDVAIDNDIIKKSGSWFSYGETRIGQGRDAVLKMLKDNVEFRNEIEQKVVAFLKDNPNAEDDNSSNE